MSPLFTGSKNKPSKKPAWSRQSKDGFSLSSFFDLEDGGDFFFRIVSWISTDYMAIYRRKRTRHSYFCCVLWLPLNILSHSFSLYALRNQDVMQCCRVRAGKESRIVCLSTEIPLSVAFAWSLNSTDLSKRKTEAGLYISDWNNFSYYILWSSWIFSVI
jgi:hypothetical protein